MATLWITVLVVLAGTAYGQNQDFDLSQFDFSGMNFNGNSPPNNGPTQAPAGLAFSNQATGNNMQQPPMASSQGNAMPMQNRPMFGNQQPQGNQIAFPQQNQNPFPQQNQNMPAQTQFQAPMQSSRTNAGSLTPEESWLTVGGSQMQNRNPALSGTVGNGMGMMNPNGQPGFPNPNGFPGNGQQGGFPNNGQPGFSNQGGRFPPNQMAGGGGFDQFGTPGNDMFTFNVNAMGSGPSDFSAFSNNPFAGTPFGEGLNLDPNQFGNQQNPNMRNAPFGRPQVSFIDPNDLPPSVRMAMNMNSQPVGGFMGPVPGGLPGLAGFTGFQPPFLTPQIQPQSRGGIGGFISRSKFFANLL